MSMRKRSTSRCTVFTTTGASLQLCGANSRRCRLEFWLNQSSTNHVSYDKGDTQTTGLYLGGTQLPIVYDAELHGDLPTRAFFTDFGAGNSINVLETFYADDAP